jgi:hypothetical protein
MDGVGLNQNQINQLLGRNLVENQMMLSFSDGRDTPRSISGFYQRHEPYMLYVRFFAQNIQQNIGHRVSTLYISNDGSTLYIVHEDQFVQLRGVRQDIPV